MVHFLRNLECTRFTEEGEKAYDRRSLLYGSALRVRECDVLLILIVHIAKHGLCDDRYNENSQRVLVTADVLSTDHCKGRSEARSLLAVSANLCSFHPFTAREPWNHSSSMPFCDHFKVLRSEGPRHLTIPYIILSVLIFLKSLLNTDPIFTSCLRTHPTDWTELLNPFSPQQELHSSSLTFRETLRDMHPLPPPVRARALPASVVRAGASLSYQPNASTFIPPRSPTGRPWSPATPTTDSAQRTASPRPDPIHGMYPLPPPVRQPVVVTSTTSASAWLPKRLPAPPAWARAPPTFVPVPMPQSPAPAEPPSPRLEGVDEPVQGLSFSSASTLVNDQDDDSLALSPASSLAWSGGSIILAPPVRNGDRNANIPPLQLPAPLVPLNEPLEQISMADRRIVPSDALATIFETTTVFGSLELTFPDYTRLSDRTTVTFRDHEEYTSPNRRQTDVFWESSMGLNLDFNRRCRDRRRSTDDLGD